MVLVAYNLKTKSCANHKTNKFSEKKAHREINNSSSALWFFEKQELSVKLERRT